MWCGMVCCGIGTAQYGGVWYGIAVCVGVYVFLCLLCVRCMYVQDVCPNSCVAISGMYMYVFLYII